MNNAIKNGVIAGLVVLVIGLGVLVFKPASIPTPTLGGLDPNIQLPYISVNGVPTYSSSRELIATSTAFCVIQNPTSATSTLEYWSLSVTSSGIASAQTFDLSTTTQSAGNSTSSPAFVKAGAIGAVNTFVAWKGATSSTTQPGVIGYDSFYSTGVSSFIVKPNEYVTARIATGTPGTFAAGYLTGKCKAVFKPIEL